MMKLKNLIVDTECAARKALKNWDYDEASLRFWRGSSNLVYRLKHRDKGYILRLSHEEENSLDKIKSELEYLAYLKQRGFCANYPISSKNGRYIEVIDTHLGRYYAVLFNEEKGMQYELEELSEVQTEAWGKALGTLHSLSKDYMPKGCAARTWKDVLRQSRDIISDLPGEEDALREADRLEIWLDSLPDSDGNYGLIHYDFESDNLFWHEESGEFSVIDFDDSMYHWYVMDIVCALEDLIKDNDPRYGEILKVFLRGYRSVKEIDDELISMIPQFLRFDNLYTFARLMRSLRDSDFEEDPEWLKRARPRLLNACERYRESFKKSYQQK